MGATVTEVRPLPIWPHTVTEAQLEMVKRAKLEIGAPFAVQPSPAVPGSPGRVLAFGEVPPFLSETVLIWPDDVGNYEVVKEKMRLWLQAPEGTGGTVTEEMWLSHVMGCNVTLAQADEAGIHLPNEEVQ